MLNLFEPWAFVLVVLASWRLTRFVVYDSLIGGHLESGTKWSRRLDSWAFTAEGKDKNWVIAKLATLLSCTWCAGAWCSLLMVCLAVWHWPWELGYALWLIVWAVAGGQAMLSAFSRKFIE